ncbi:MAG: DedA family protein [Candidatus Falkowbacteria bacterium]|nr:DedA family protein [Candidatus Falkowbacteria bacterium]
MFEAIIQWVLNLTQGLGYTGVTILMAIESSFLPLPSELVIPPAAWLASEGKMSLGLLIIAGTIGSVIGASINYLLSMWLGRMIIYKLADKKFFRVLGLKREKIGEVEKMFLSDAKRSTFVGRFIPVVRHLISIPAGFCRMNYGSFVLYTALGSFFWVSILAALGFFLGANRQLLEQYYQEISWLLLFLGIIWLIWKFRKKIFHN